MIIIQPYLRTYERDILPKSREDPKYDKDIEIKVGHFVKLRRDLDDISYSFWVEVLEVRPSSLKGRIDNDIPGDVMKYNEIIQFNWCNIMDFGFVFDDRYVIVRFSFSRRIRTVSPQAIADNFTGCATHHRTS